MINLLLPVLFILLIGIFTASETAFLYIEKIKVKRAYSEGKRWAKRVQYFIQSPEQFFTTILFCEDFLLVLASTFFAQFVIQNFGHKWLVFSTIIISIFSLNVGQYIPKSIALINPQKTLILLSEVLFIIKILLTPIVYSFSLLIRLLDNIFKIHYRKDILKHRDIIFAISEYEKDSSLLASRLFDFSRRRVEEVMIPIGMAFILNKNEDILSICIQSKKIFTRIPIYDGDKNNIIGVINTKEYFYTNKLDPKPPYFLKTSDRCMEVFLTMRKNKEHIGIVRDNNKVVGIITIEDLVEELVGEIREET
uniref:DUF21 domain-containing protein n=1 Tax=candidate division WOR-3 bacterium TaxID=2052148 RepID=A0A7C4TCQ9_UNCW3